MIKRLILVLLALAVVFGGIFGWKWYQMQQMAAEQAKPQPPAVVASAQVKEASWQPYLFGVGSMTAIQGVFVSNEIEGQVESIAFESGKRVEKGELLVQLDDSVDRADLEGLIAERELAQVEFDRESKLLADNSTSKAQYDRARAQLQGARAQVEAQRARIRKKAIRAPFSGVLGIRQVDLGQYLAAGSQIVSLQSLDPVYVDYMLPERHMDQIAVGQAIGVRVQAYPQAVFEGQVTAIDPRIDEATRQVQVRATVANEDGRLRPGMFANVETLVGSERRVLTLPRTAITYNPYGDSVFRIVDEDGGLVVQRQQVKTGRSRDGRVEIVSGLEKGQRVVRAGQVKLRNGQAVEIDNSVELDEQVAAE